VISLAIGLVEGFMIALTLTELAKDYVSEPRFILCLFVYVPVSARASAFLKGS
jgi:hypothetical protein